MPKMEVEIFAEDNGSCPLIEWMDNIPPKAQDKCIVKVERLSEIGSELRRPEADFLRDKIHELRAAFRGIQYRLLYFFCNKKGIISHGLIKKGDKVPTREIDLAIKRKKKYENNPLRHTFKE